MLLVGGAYFIDQSTLSDVLRAGIGEGVFERTLSEGAGKLALIGFDMTSEEFL